MLDPKLIANQFDDAGNAVITTLFAGKLIKVVYQNPEKIHYGQYRISSITIEDQPVEYLTQDGKPTIARRIIAAQPAKIVKISVLLGSIT
jgi:hypothetical protein